MKKFRIWATLSKGYYTEVFAPTEAQALIKADGLELEDFIEGGGDDWTVDSAEEIEPEYAEPKTSQFKNGFTSWYETFYEVVSMIENISDYKTLEAVSGGQGTGGRWEFAKETTDEFEAKNEGREWDGEFYDEVEEFVEEKIKKVVKEYDGE